MMLPVPGDILVWCVSAMGSIARGLESEHSSTVGVNGKVRTLVTVADASLDVGFGCHITVLATTHAWESRECLGVLGLRQDGMIAWYRYDYDNTWGWLFADLLDSELTHVSLVQEWDTNEEDHAFVQRVKYAERLRLREGERFPLANGDPNARKR